MHGVPLIKHGMFYQFVEVVIRQSRQVLMISRSLDVPGLAENRPSVLVGMCSCNLIDCRSFIYANRRSNPCAKARPGQGTLVRRLCSLCSPVICRPQVQRGFPRTCSHKLLQYSLQAQPHPVAQAARSIGERVQSRTYPLPEIVQCTRTSSTSSRHYGACYLQSAHRGQPPTASSCYFDMSTPRWLTAFHCLWAVSTSPCVHMQTVANMDLQTWYRQDCHDR